MGQRRCLLLSACHPKQSNRIGANYEKEANFHSFTHSVSRTRVQRQRLLLPYVDDSLDSVLFFFLEYYCIDLIGHHDY